MSTIGIIGAMEEEVVNIKSDLEIISTKNIIGLDFYMGKMSGNNVIIVRSGIGKVNAAICAQILIDLYAVDYIINVGVAGAISRELNIGDVVVSSDTVHHDFDTSKFGDPVGVISRMDESFFKADETLIALAGEAFEKLNTENKLYVGRIASGDQFISGQEQKNKIWLNFKPLCVEMEGAAIAHTCYLNKIPFVIIRSISDRADEAAEVSFDKFVQHAADISAKVVQNIVVGIT